MTSANRARGPIPEPLAFLGPVLEPLYRLVIAHRNRRFDSGTGVTRLPIPVISIGNLSVGGTGKTPLVAHTVSTLLRAGRRPCIAMRGYQRGKPAAANHVPDETDLYQRDFPGLPIVAQPDRAAGVLDLIQKYSATASAHAPPDCIVLDDGFQHRRIARDLDIVIIDASRSPFEDRLLPAGFLREPVSSLARAHILVISHTELVTPRDLATLRRHLAALDPRDSKAPVPIALTRHLWTDLKTDSSIPEARHGRLPLDWLLGKRAVAACAIGNPEGFLHCLRATLDAGRAGHSAPDTTPRPAHQSWDTPPGTLAAATVLPDHDPFLPGTVQRILETAASSRADCLVVTEKDWSKLRRLPPQTWAVRRAGERTARTLPVIRPTLSMVFDRTTDSLGPEGFEQRILAAAGSMPRT